MQKSEFLEKLNRLERALQEKSGTNNPYTVSSAIHTGDEGANILIRSQNSGVAIPLTRDALEDFNETLHIISQCIQTLSETQFPAISPEGKYHKLEIPELQ